MSPPTNEDAPPPPPEATLGSPSAGAGSSLSGGGWCGPEAGGVGNPMEERKAIKATHEFNVQAGGKYFLVDAQWWNQWREWCGLDELGGVDEPVVSRGPRPGPVDNSALFAPGSTAKLRLNLRDGADYELLLPQEWALFEDWYKDDNADDAAATEQEDEASCGGDPVLVELAVEESDKESGGGGVGGAEEVAKQADALPKSSSAVGFPTTQNAIVRRGIRQNAYSATSKTAVVEIYGLTVKVCLSSALDELAVGEKPVFFEMVVSKASTVRELKESIMEKCGFEAGKDCRLWDWFQNKPYALLDVPSKTLQDAQVIENNDLLLELPDAATGSFKIVKAPSATSSSVNLYGSGGGGGGSTTENVVTSSVAPPCVGVCGLQNLGNTCFMNSTLQCLSNCPPLRDYFVSSCFVGDLNRGNPLGQEGQLAESFGDLLSLMWPHGQPNGQPTATQPTASTAAVAAADDAGGGGGGLVAVATATLLPAPPAPSSSSSALLPVSSVPVSSVAPRGFKYHMGRFRPEFQGYQQHDSSELMNFLLDGLHEDLNRVKVKPYTEAVEDDGKTPGHELAKQVLDVYKKRNDSFIHDLFRAQFKSTLVCPDCGNVSVTYDPYTMVSLPLTTAAEERQQFYKVNVWTTNGLTSFTSGNSSGAESDNAMADSTENNADAADADAAQPPPASEAAEEEAGGVCDWKSMVNEDGSAWLGGAWVGSGGRTRKKAMKVGVNKGSKVGALRKAVADVLGLPPGRVALFQSTRSYVMKCMDDNASLDFLSKHYDICAHEVADEYPFSYTAPIKYTSTYWGGHQQQAAKAPSRPESPLAAVTLYFGQKREGAAGATYFYNNNRRPNATWTLFGDPWLFNVPKNPLTPKELYQAVAAALGITDAFNACQENNTSLFTLFVCNDVYGHTVDQTAVEMSDVPLNGGLKALITIVVQFHESVASEALRGKKMVGVPGVPAAALTDDAAATTAENGGGGGGGGGAEVKAEEADEEEEDSGGLKLLDCFDLFSAPEKLSPEDAWYCGKCKNHVEATKTMELWSVPDVLVLHLKRFSYSRYSRDKLETDVSFPLNGLDVSKFVKGPQGSVSAGGGVDEPAAASSSVFDCVAVSNHMGSLGGGHYTASARSGVDGKWYKFNDSSTSEMQPSSVNSGDVYLLFYVRRGKFGTSCDPDLEAKGDVV